VICCVAGQSCGYIQKLRKLYAEDECHLRRNKKPVLFMECNLKFLQNIQDFWWNSLWYKPKPDNLQLITEPYVPYKDGKPVNDKVEDADNEEEADLEENCYENLLQSINLMGFDDDNDEYKPTQMSFERLRDG
jgi:hypothetical protein